MDHGKPVIDWAVAARPRLGEAESGDAHLVRKLDESALIAVVDGLGHGAEAARAARIAIAVAESYASSPLPQIAMHCHASLRETRGAVMTLARIDARAETLTWLGIGNVTAVLIRAGDRGRDRHVLVPRGGLVGDQLQNATSATLPLSSGDTLIVTTDGIQWNPHDGPVLDGDPAATAQQLLDACAVANDDALVLVARCRR